MKIKVKAIIISAACMAIFGVIASGKYSTEETYLYLTDVELRTVKNSPPISDQSIFYKGDYTDIEYRNLLALANPIGLMVTDNLLNHYFVAGDNDVDFKTAKVFGAGKGRYRLCDAALESNCIHVSKVTEYRNRLSELYEGKSRGNY